MAIPISVETDSGFSKLSPQINQAIRSSVRQTLTKIADKWQSEAQYALRSTSSVRMPWLNNAIKYPLDHAGFEGSITLPDLSQPGSLALDIRSSPIPNRSPFILGSVPMPASRSNLQSLKSRYNPHRQSAHSTWVNQQKSKDYAALSRIVRGYNPKPQKGNDPLKQMAQRLKSSVRVESIMPFAQDTFVKMLATNLNGLY